MPVKSGKTTVESKSSAGRAKTASGQTVKKDPVTKKGKKAKVYNEDAIKLKAYYKFLERGRVNGKHEQDWYDAEKEDKDMS
ncbi:MAG: DUF2934 domain-containing protein [Elusimicrobiota bacterium]